PDDVEVDGGVAATGGLRDHPPDRSAQPIRPHGVEAGPALADRLDDPRLIGTPELGDLRDRRHPAADRVGPVLAEAPAAEAIDDRHLVVAESVGMVLVEVERGVVDEELADLALPEGEDQPARPLLVGEVEAVVVPAVPGAVEEVQALVA